LSAHRFVAGMRRSTGLLVLCIWSGLLIALQLLIPSLAFASTSRIATGPALFSQQEVLELAGVSVVRLVVTYQVSGSSSKTSTVLCSGLGVIVGSWSPSSPTDKNTWVLTDSFLVNTAGTSCKGSSGELTAIEVLANATYTAQSSSLVSIGRLTCQQALCRDASSGTSETVDDPASAGGGLLFSFHSDAQHLQPFLTIASPDSSATGTPVGIELADGNTSSASWPTSSFVTAPNTLTRYLVPDAITSLPGSSPGNVSSTATLTGTPPLQATPAPPLNYEPGMPLVASDGTLTGIYVNENTSINATQINVLLSQEPEFSPAAQGQHKNPLEANWQKAIQAYYTQDYLGAHTALTAIANANPDFKAAAHFDQQFVDPELQRNSHSTSTPGVGNSGNGTILGFPAQQVILVAIIAVVILLALLLIVVSLTFGQARARRKQELAQFEADQAEAQRLAEIEAQRQQAKITARLQSPFSTVRCPNCGVQVTAGDSACPNCHYLLSASDSGLHLRAVPPPPVEPPPQMSPAQAYSGTPSSPSVSEISEMPTLQFPPSNGNANDAEKTQPYDIQQLQGMNLSLAVGARTDRGIKRKHKPNEDNYFALQAPRPTQTQPQEFGLFVVADGMGGHANGQDASRLAIQTIIDFMLPKLASNEPMSEDDFKNLLNEGVQRANQAVHQRNMEERADMGTTMTAALIVGAVAYVANVGDSRTYLYREPEGLIKITHDHSVVASLVDAGIIKPDDIYTHPKRNQIYRSLGEKPYVEVDTFKVPLQVGDKLLLCSDGLWDMVRDPEIQRLMSAPAPDPNKTGKELVQAALDGGGEDNVSVIVVYINEMSSQPTISNVQLIAKPENVTLPELPLPGV
jgi:serine/threonine protein phosphatase PrpC/type II secretory pathway pseudopilin PulG